ncbi:hypothetical protein EYF80_004302 [Liparis tanakae]|uniref:Uncharacterized protein n=1 Tax=Liparis tanakae TaxID=230148 RepID=A0A4Z2J531_9TELE|nr:hypothetical protein EYF80_004302 [Liparis tanakae]
MDEEVLKTPWLVEHLAVLSREGSAMCRATLLQQAGLRPRPCGSFSRWTMKRCRDSERREVKHGPHSGHWWDGPSDLCWGMCSWKAAMSSVVKPQTAHL